MKSFQGLLGCSLNMGTMGVRETAYRYTPTIVMYN